MLLKLWTQSNMEHVIVPVTAKTVLILNAHICDMITKWLLS